MPRQFTLPDLGEGLTEAEIVKVLVTEGAVIAEDAPLLEVETDKATVEIPSPMGGRVEKIHVAAGQTVRVGAVLVTFGDSTPSGPHDAQPPDAARRPLPAPVTATTHDAAPTSAPASVAGGPADGPVPATPATRRLARELRVDLRTVHGTGPGGRVTDADVRAVVERPRPPARDGAVAAAEEPPAPQASAKPLATPLAQPPLPAFEQWGEVERRPLSHLRRMIAERMTLSATVVPHVTHFDRADITELDAMIAANLEPARALGVTLTLTAFILKAAALALREHPTFNASLDAAAGELVVKRYVRIGVAVATDRGLIVPILDDVDRRSVLDIARDLAALARRTREGKATLDELRGGTFTVTNVGALGGTGAIPIINYPEVAILGVARARLEPAVRDGAIVPRLLLPLSLTFDHRVADGADGARFASAIVRRLERPDQLLLGL